MIEVKEKLGLDVRDETITAKVLADMVPIDGTEEQKISALHEKLMSGGVSDEDLQALREQAQAATKIQVGLPEDYRRTAVRMAVLTPIQSTSLDLHTHTPACTFCFTPLSLHPMTLHLKPYPPPIYPPPPPQAMIRGKAARAAVTPLKPAKPE